MLKRSKNLARDALPKSAQVPIKYWYGAARGDLEAEMALLPFLVRPTERAIDVGGNRGTYAYRLWKLGAQVEVFEPNPHCASILASWAAGKATVRVHPVALSSRDGRAQLHVPVDEHGVVHDASATVEALEPLREASLFDVEVPLRTLDSFAFDRAELLKIDVEGHEASVLEGASGTLAKARPALLVEIEQRHNQRSISDVFEAIATLGYRGFFLLGGRLTPLSHFDVERHQSLSAFQAGSADYHNNFIFLASEKMESGRYSALLAQWGGPA